MNSFFKRFIAGIVIGIGAIIPGFSGGILAVSMGLYKPTIDAFAGFFKAPKKNLKFLLPLILGGALGFIIFLFLIDKLFASCRTYVIAVFVGLVIGSMPSLFRECNEKGFKKSYPVWSVIGFIVAGGLIALGLISNAGAPREITPLLAVISGAIIMSGVLLPGISISFILLNLGVYENFMHVFTNPPKLFIASLRAGEGFGTAFSNIVNGLPLMLWGALGFVIVAVPVLLLVKKVIDRFHGPAYYLIFGIVIATTIGCVVQEIFNLAADQTFVFKWWKPVLCAALIAAGAALSVSTEKFMRYKEEKEENKEEDNNTEVPKESEPCEN